MTYDRELAERMRDVLADQPELTERAMFGGLAFLIGGHMTVVAGGDGDIMVRADPAISPELVETTPAGFAVMHGRELKGWLCLDVDDVADDDVLATWVDRAVRYSATLPPKPGR